MSTPLCSTRIQRLVDIADDTLAHGTVFRVPGQWPYEPVVDFMLFDYADVERPHGLIVTTGHKAGLILVLLPRQSGHDQWRGARTAWIVSEWARWIYPECAVDDVQVLRRYPAPMAALPAIG
ncbi:hypothetical protein D3C71_954920 [compost metagenome]